MNDRIPPMFTLGQAAKVAGKIKTTISKAVANGKISATHDDRGQYQIHPAELSRVYPITSLIYGKGVHDKTPNERTVDTPSLQIEIDGLNAQLELMKTLLKLMKESVSDLKDQREGWQKQADLSWPTLTRQ
jgi:hypothetical protein